MPGKSISLSTKHRRFISREIKAGHYRSEAEVVRAGLDLLEMQKLKEGAREKLRQEIQKGIDELDAGLGVTLRTRKERIEHFNALRDTVFGSLKAIKIRR